MLVIRLLGAMGLVTLFGASPSFAKTVQVTLDDQEQAALQMLLDDGVKYGGLAVAGNADFLWRKVQGSPAPPDPAPPPSATTSDPNASK